MTSSPSGSAGCQLVVLNRQVNTNFDLFLTVALEIAIQLVEKSRMMGLELLRPTVPRRDNTLRRVAVVAVSTVALLGVVFLCVANSEDAVFLQTAVVGGRSSEHSYGPEAEEILGKQMDVVHLPLDTAKVSHSVCVCVCV